MHKKIKTGLTKSELKFHMGSLGTTGILAEYLTNFRNSNFDHDSCQIGLQSENRGKSRYRNIYCLDSTRVKLPSSRFIHANYVDGASNSKKYIITQAPNMNTITDFYEMIMENQSSIIVDLTKTNECSEDKCFPYWKDHSEYLINTTYTIRPVSATKKRKCIVTSDLVLTKYNSKHEHKIKHVHYVNWPDHGVPTTPYDIKYLINYVEYLYLDFARSQQIDSLAPNNPPIIVHCNAGVGRSGVFVLISILREFFMKRGKINLKDTLKLLRQQRLQCVQTPIQYLFCYQTISDFIDQN